ncbi:MAG TPA: site-specific DNA-methyltransferase [Chitinophagaceae bacterium]|jgi:DNA modification methylase
MNKVIFGDCRESIRKLASKGIQVRMCVTSPPYFGLRDYSIDGQIGQEKTPEQYVSNLVEIFRGIKNILADDGTFWLNLGDSYWGSWGNFGNRPELDNKTLNQREKKTDYINRKGFDDYRDRPPSSYKHPVLKNKDLIGIPWRVAFALQADGWFLRQDIIWHKPNPMPSSIKDRCTTAHEYLFLFSKSKKYYFDYKALQEPATNAGKVVQLGEKSFSKGQANGAGVKPSGNGCKDTVPNFRNKRSVWTIPTKGYKGAHCAAYPPNLIIPCILAGSRKGDIVFDPFMGSGTTAQVAVELGRQYLGCELNPEYEKLINARLEAVEPAKV